MSLYPVIHDVSETLRKLLDDNLVASDSLAVTVDSPQRVTLSTEHLLNLYLYQVVEAQFTRNRGPMFAGSHDQKRAPLPLNLFYMVTPYINQNVDGKDEHLILGDAMRVLYDHPVLTDPLLQGSLAGSGDQICLVLCKMNLEELTRIWNALQMPYRLSVCYEVRIALVDSQQEWEIGRVETQETEYAISGR